MIFTPPAADGSHIVPCECESGKAKEPTMCTLPYRDGEQKPTTTQGEYYQFVKRVKEASGEEGLDYLIYLALEAKLRLQEAKLAHVQAQIEKHRKECPHRKSHA
jgi:hypothetical protein